MDNACVSHVIKIFIIIYEKNLEIPKDNFAVLTQLRKKSQDDQRGIKRKTAVGKLNPNRRRYYKSS